MDWRNRITGSGVKPASEFLANPANWRIHPKAQQSALSGVLSEVGWVQQVVENIRTGNLIDGHLRVMLALQEGDDSPVPYLEVDLSEEEERLVLAALDPIGAMAFTDSEKLGELLRDVRSGDAAVQAMLADLADGGPFGRTATDRDGQGVTSSWDQLRETDNCRVVIGDIETRLSPDVAATLRETLNSRFERDRVPINQTFEAIIVAGVSAVADSGD